MQLFIVIRNAQVRASPCFVLNKESYSISYFNFMFFILTIENKAKIEDLGRIRYSLIRLRRILTFSTIWALFSITARLELF